MAYVSLYLRLLTLALFLRSQDLREKIERVQRNPMSAARETVAQGAESLKSFLQVQASSIADVSSKAFSLNTLYNAKNLGGQVISDSRKAVRWAWTNLTS